MDKESKTREFVHLPSSITRKSGVVVDALLRSQQMENAALTMCGGLLSECYLLAEIADSIMVDALGKMKKHKWFRQEIKKTFNESARTLKASLAQAVGNSPTNTEYMRESADQLYEFLHDDIFKLENTMYLELGRLHVKDAAVVAKIMLVSVIFAILQFRYDRAIEYMKGIYNAFYDSWYSHARCNRATALWNKGMDAVVGKNTNKTLNINAIPFVEEGVTILLKKMNDENVMELINRRAAENADSGNDIEGFINAVSLLKGRAS